VVNGMAKRLQVGTKVRVPWGLEGPVEGEIVEVWGDPPAHVRVQLRLDSYEDSEPIVILLSPKDLEAA
jgi:hypothetical protein